jgi:hypothetical protein
MAMTAIPKLKAQVVIQTGNGQVQSGAYASPTTRDIFVRYVDENGNVSSPGVATYTRFFVDKPRSCELEWKNRIEDFYDGVKGSGEDSYNKFTTIHGEPDDVVVRVGCIIMDQYGFFMHAEPAIVTVLAPSYD